MSEGQSFECLAKTLTGLEETLASELRALGAEKVEAKHRSVRFRASQATMYRANLCARTALRILMPVATFRVRNEEHLYDRVRALDWGNFMSVDATLAVDSVVSSPHFRHSKYVALKTKDAIVDRFRQEFHRRPSVDVVRPDLRVNVHIAQETCTISIDSSGDSLHKRGYRLQKHIAPLNEVLAAGLVLLSGWDGATPFLDPMCGSGTIPIEAAMIAGNIAPGLGRKHFGFMTWPDFDSLVWERALEEARADICTGSQIVFASDKSERACVVAEANIKRAGLEARINLSRADFADLPAPPAPGILVMNPPYGERMRPADIFDAYHRVGDTLKQNFAGYDAWILSSNRQALKHVGLRATKKLTVFNGPLECRFQKFSMYTGSKKSKYGVASDST